MASSSAPSTIAEPPTADRPTTVGEVMRPGIVTCLRTSTAADVARIMREARTDCVVILSNGHGVEQFPFVWGLVTREDLVRPLAELEPVVTAEELTRTPVVRARPELTLAQARSLCDAVGVTHLLVIDGGHGTPLGIVSDAELAPGLDDPAREKEEACTTTS